MNTLMKHEMSFNISFKQKLMKVVFNFILKLSIKLDSISH